MMTNRADERRKNYEFISGRLNKNGCQIRHVQAGERHVRYCFIRRSINQMNSRLSTAKKGVESFRKDLLSLRSKMGEVDQSISDLGDLMEEIKAASDTQSLKFTAISDTEPYPLTPVDMNSSSYLSL